ncbi:hypothetical protein KM043_014305 [Ampulex compressa]|nr:hypothetical protein KM043_014305 [Ampulex compressa]
MSSSRKKRKRTNEDILSRREVGSNGICKKQENSVDTGEEQGVNGEDVGVEGIGRQMDYELIKAMNKVLREEIREQTKRFMKELGYEDIERKGEDGGGEIAERGSKVGIDGGEKEVDGEKKAEWGMGYNGVVQDVDGGKGMGAMVEVSKKLGMKGTMGGENEQEDESKEGLFIKMKRELMKGECLKSGESE